MFGLKVSFFIPKPKKPFRPPNRKNLEAAPRIIFAVFHSFQPFRHFPAFFAVFRRFSPLLLFFRRFSSFFTVFNRLSQLFYILLNRLFTVFFHRFFMDFFPGYSGFRLIARIEWVQNLKVRGSRHSILAKRHVSLSKETFPKICVPQKCAINQCQSFVFLCLLTVL